MPIYPILIRTETRLLHPYEEKEQYLQATIRTPKLDRIHQYLWLAGLPKAARPLHRQKLLGRELVVTENADEHLVWYENRVFLKPLPGFLLNFKYWEATLHTDRELHRSACGLLLSYAWLVSYESDLKIAKETGLLPSDISWLNWTTFLQDFLSNINLESLEQVDRRYHYGELRLNRLNSIYRTMPAVFSLSNMIRGGFMSSSTWQSSLFRRNFAWLLTVLVYLTVILSALQVGLATDQLKGDAAFAWASYGFCVACILLILLIMGVVLLVWFMLFSFHVISALRFYRLVESQRRSSAAASP
ncbi:MAG: hypothetical protein M1820_008239 [Bogoriella megaspora]|nr:MAG: hypothetical protein M1820_008239 [Bogoriella megaspora]